MANLPINRGGINTGPINGPPSVYVDGSAELLHDETFGGDAESIQRYLSAQASLGQDHTFEGTAQSKVFGRGGINSRPINSGQINGELGLYASGKATMQHGHGLTGDLTFGSDTYVFGTAELGHDHSLPADLTFWQNYFSDGAAVLTHAHTLEGDLTFWFSTIVYGQATLQTDHGLTADLTFYQNYYVDAQAGLPEGHSLTGDGQMVWLGSATLTHDETLSGDLTEGSDIYRFGSIVFTHGHTFEGDFKEYIPIDASLSLVTNHTFDGDLTLLPYNDASATLVHDHDLEWTDTQSVLCQARMTHTNILTGNALGGTPAIDLDNLWTAAEPYPDIEIAAIDLRKEQYFGVNYTVEGFRYSPSELNHCTLGTAPLNGPCGSYPEPDLSGQLDLAYGLGETQASLDMQWDFVFDAQDESWQMDMQYDLDISTKTLVQASLDMGWFCVGKDLYQDLLDLVNEKRVEIGAVPYLLYSGEGEDVATTHSQNMVETQIYAHEDTGLPAGYQTIAQRVFKIKEGPTRAGENIAYFFQLFPLDPFTNEQMRDATFPTAQELFDNWWNSPPHKANMLYNWSQADRPEMLLGMSVSYTWDYANTGLPTISYAPTQLFVAYGIPAGATLNEGQLNMTYDLDVSLIIDLNVGYSLDAYVAVTQQLTSEYGINVAAQNELPYGAKVAAQHEAPIHYSTVAQHEMTWGGTAVVTYQHEAGYSMDEYNQVLKSSSNLYDINLSAQFETSYALTKGVITQHEAGYEPSVRAITQHEAQYGVTTNNPVRASHTGFYALHQSGVQVTTSFATITLKR